MINRCLFPPLGVSDAKMVRVKKLGIAAVLTKAIAPFRINALRVIAIARTP
jgi:hypothetical protein